MGGEVAKRGETMVEQARRARKQMRYVFTRHPEWKSLVKDEPVAPSKPRGAVTFDNAAELADALAKEGDDDAEAAGEEGEEEGEDEGEEEDDEEALEA